ncbi:hypothetical protein C1637_09910 [Chryseobacterium lactis]|uniref:Uncharacterized protein n=1 Tax=Chryseobacterium lactis TaxID=1241981 RepID=A0A3G6RL33_CHRLC|nr:hypothetical protein EG342_09790 [Chryseobacterium lactis]AZB02556.1 hypothetical protein EG341_00645 [Chryseobacterium lactis]PNW14149.1 hypothetical protein C1637_09910 [Chryseobacterium lactis]
MLKPIHILKGWFRSYFSVSEKIRILSEQRLVVCRNCPFAVEKSFLKFRENQAMEEKTKACEKCGCPIIEKSLVEDEKCPMNLWKK